MKHPFSYLLLIALGAAGCVKERISEPEVHILHASVEGDGTTKADISDAGAFTWNTGDAIAVFKSGSASSTYTASSTASQSDFELSTGAAIDAPDYAIYPASAAVIFEPIVVRLPHEWTIKEGASSGTAKMPMLAQGDGSSNLVFKHLGGMLKLNVSTVATDVTQFVVSFPGKKVNGDFLVNFSEPNPFIETEDAYDTAPSEFVISYAAARTAADTDCILYIPLPVGSYNGVQVDMKNAGGDVIASFSRGAFSIARKKLCYISAGSKVFNLGQNVIDATTLLTDDTMTLPDSEDGVSLDLSGVANTDRTITLQYSAGSKPKTVYLISPTSPVKSNITLAGTLPQSTVNIITGSYKATSMTTAASTLIVGKDAAVKDVTIMQGNASIAGKVDNVIVDDNATADGGSTPVKVTVLQGASSEDGSAVTIKAGTNISVVAQSPVVLEVSNGAIIDMGDDIDRWTQFSSKWDGVSTAPVSQVDEDHFEIYNAAQFAQFRDNVNSGTSYAGKMVTLKSGIDLAGYNWVPIGNSENNVFLGTFEGSYLPVSGLVIAQTGDRAAGLFGTIQAVNEHHVAINNVWIADIVLTSQHQAGGVLGRYDGQHVGASLSISGCVVEYGSITSSAWADGDVYRGGNEVGGIVGCATGYGITIEGSGAQNLTIQGTRDVGGIAGRLQTPVSFYRNEVNDCHIGQDYPETLEDGVDLSTVDGLVGKREGEWEVDRSNNYVWDSFVMSKQAVWDGSRRAPLSQVDEDHFEIRSAAQLAQLAYEVNAGTTTYAGKTISLMTDLDLDNHPWTPIGLGDAEADDSANNVFLGTFEGNNHIIFKLHVERTGDRSFAGLFGTIQVTDSRTVTIRNILLGYPSVTSNHHAACVLGRYKGLSSGAKLLLDNITVAAGLIQSTAWDDNGTWRGGNMVGGIVGEASGYGVSITHCQVYGMQQFQATRDMGFIAGAMSAPESFTGNYVQGTLTQVYPDGYATGLGLEASDLQTIGAFVGLKYTDWTIDESSNQGAGSVSISWQE